MMIDAERIEHVLRAGTFDTVFHPVVCLQSGRVVGVDALTRVPGEERPDVWLQAAHRAGLGVDLELAIANAALEAAAGLPLDVCLWVSLSPRSLLAPQTHGLLVASPVPTLGVRLTGPTDDSEAEALGPTCHQLQHSGVQVALEDRDALALSSGDEPVVSPDEVRIAHLHTQRVATGPGRTHARDVIDLCRRLRARATVHGVQSPDQLQRWRELGADQVRGGLLGGPAPLADIMVGGAIDLPEG